MIDRSQRLHIVVVIEVVESSLISSNFKEDKVNKKLQVNHISIQNMNMISLIIKKRSLRSNIQNSKE